MSLRERQITSRDDMRQMWIGLALAGLIIGTWLAIHISTIFLYAWEEFSTLLILFIVMLQTWLTVGLFIIAHDCMHGSLAPFRLKVNQAVGQLCLGLYAGFYYGKFNRKHHRHHRFSGTEHDPDFRKADAQGFWQWYWSFFREYFTWREFAVINVIVFIYVGILGADSPSVLAFWAFPAIASSVQLFAFGTYLPHRPDEDAFDDHHRARSNNYSWLLSLLTCFHFGYHHEHHAHPRLPWWRLPSAREAPD